MILFFFSQSVFDLFLSAVHVHCKKEGKLHYRTAKVQRSQKTLSISSFESGI